MIEYIIRRLIFMVVVLLLLSIAVFTIAHLTPGSPIDRLAGPRASPETRARLTAEYGLDQPWPVQYLRYMEHVVRGDFGRSIISGQPILNEIARRLPITLELGITAFAVAYAVAIPIGILAAVRRYTFLDFGASFFALVGMAVPNFWTGLMLILVFSVWLGWLPVSGYGSVQQLIMPAVALALPEMAGAARIVRSSMLEVLKRDYIRTAQAKGLSVRAITYGHAFRNSLLPLLSLAGLHLGWLVGGAVILEVIFARPGLGRMMVDAIFQRDFPVTQGTMLVLGASVILVNIITDVAYAFVDPRIRYK